MKRIFGLIFGALYLLILIFSLIVLLKPDLPLFYNKQQIENQKLIPDGSTFSYQFNVDIHFYNPGTISVLEDQRTLTLSSSEDTTSIANGSFAIENTNENQITVQIVPTTSSNPQMNGHSYSIEIRPYLISSNFAGLIFLLLVLGAIAFLGSNLVNPQKHKALLSSPFSVIGLWINLFDRPIHHPNVAFVKPDFGLLKRSAVNTLLAAFSYVLMEWIFYATKPSFMDRLTLGDKVAIFLVTGLVAALLSLLVLVVIALLDFILSPFFPSFRKYAFHFPTAFLLSCLCLILLDNFTYTVFKFGIVDSKTLLRVLYGLGFVCVLIYFLKQLAVTREYTEKQLLNKVASWSAIALAVIALILAGFTFEKTDNDLSQTGQNSDGENRPNVILFGTDGLNAADMSVYGYDRDTTPFITDLAQSSLLSQNNFSNAGSSLGSDTATLTGKMPLTTRVLYAPDILQGTDEYQHLPGILKSAGYRTVFLGEKYYDDVNSINFQGAFDSVQCKENNVAVSSLISGYGFDEEFYFSTTLWGRIGDRLEHIFFIKDMVNPYVQVTETATQTFDDQDRMQCLLSELERANRTGQPVFIQVHLEETHGEKFWPATNVFSKGETQDQDWMTDWYDDAILDYDAEVKELVQSLKDNGQYDNTLLILYTDHAQQYITTNKIPLILHFPNDQYAGTITQNTENLDIAPTILDYLNFDQPTWMAGNSLLGKLDPNRLILDPSVVSAILNPEGLFYVPADALKPPFYQFRSLTAIQCQNWFTFDLQNMTVSQGTIANYSDACPADSLDSLDVIREKVGAILKQNSFDVPDNW
jgi:arylsulfatase A-like enzyme